MGTCSVCVCSQGLDEDMASPGAGSTGDCELPGIGAGNRTQVLGKSSDCS